jgi:hypothetical protein
MISNAIDEEIRRTRETLVNAFDGDLRLLGDHLRAGEARWAALGHPVVSFVGEMPLEFLCRIGRRWMLSRRTRS